MKHYSLYAAATAVALAATSPASAQLLGGGGGAGGVVGGAVSGQGGIGATLRDTARIGSQGSAKATTRARERANVNSAVRADSVTDVTATAGEPAKAVPDAAANARLNSQGAANASVKGLSKASTNSALNAAGRTDLGAVADGMTVTGSGGANIGTVSEVILNRSGAVVGVEVALAGGGMATIPASTLTLSGSALITSWVHQH